MATDVTEAPASRSPGTYIFVSPVPVTTVQIESEVSLQLDAATKRASGIILTFALDVSTDAGVTWVPLLTAIWTSYGKNGSPGATLPDGTVIARTGDPFLRAPMVNRKDQQIRGRLVVTDTLTVGVKVERK